LSIGSLFLEVIFIVFLVIINGFFSCAEIAIISSKRSVIDKLAQEGNESARLVLEMKNEPERFLATIQIGITVVSTLGSVVGGVIAVRYLQPVFAAIPISLIRNGAEIISLSIVVILLSYALLVVGELAPKSLALKYADRIACFAAKPLNLLSKRTGLLVRLLTASTKFTLKNIGVKDSQGEVFLPREEIRYHIREGRAHGVLEETEAALLHGVFNFADTTVKEVMVPKPQFIAIDIDTAEDEILHFMTESGFSRYPVYKDNLNHIKGILFNKDVFRVLESEETLVLSETIRAPYFVPSSIKISRLLREMQRRKLHMAIVVDEDGEVDGLVTIEDILEEIVGEIEDEYDVEKGGLIEKQRDGTMIIDASISLVDLNDAGIPFNEDESKEFNTLAGIMLDKLQRIPRGGEFITHNGYRFTVVDMEQFRIAKIKAELLSTRRRKNATQAEQKSGESSERIKKPETET
jgi:putative hemolysin